MTAPDPTSTSRYTSRADVPTDVPARYAKQLVSHLGRRIDFGLVLQAEAPDVESLARVEHALGSHLERFGQRKELTVTWQRSTAPPA